jgi:hypothetical protein
MTRKKQENIENTLLGQPINIEEEIDERLEREIQAARQPKQEIIITDIKKVSAEKKFDKLSIYRVFNRKQKTETFVNGIQAEDMMRYTDDYIIRFDHRIEMR